MATATKAPVQELSSSSHIGFVPVAKMRINKEAQATYTPARAERIAATFDPDAMGLILVNHITEEDIYHVVDGQHRRAALLIMGYEDQKVECEIFTDLTDAEEAYLFRKRNEHRRPSALDSFLVALTQGDTEAQKIAAAVASSGFVISKGNTQNAVKAIAALYAIFDMGGVNLIKGVLTVLKESFGYSREAVSANFLRGMGLFLQRYGNKVNRTLLVDKLAKTPLGAHSLVVKANVLQKQMGRPKDNCFAAAFVEVYNSGKGGRNKLESWWK